MASNKKTKKSKGVTLSFQEFSAKIDGDSTPSGNVVYAPKKSSSGVMSSWADEVEEDDFLTSSTPSTTTKERIILPTAPRAARGPAYEDALIPKTPPFQANMGNLHYDIEEEDIYKFFRDLEILDLKLPRDHVTGRIKGFGFVVFATRQDLIDALVMNEGMLRGRPVRVALLSGEQRGQERGGGRGEYTREAPADEGVDNWRSVAGETVKSGGGGGGYNRGEDRGGFRGQRSGGQDQDQEQEFNRSEMRSDYNRQPHPQHRGEREGRDGRGFEEEDSGPWRREGPGPGQGGGGQGGQFYGGQGQSRDPRDPSDSFEFTRGPTQPRPQHQPRPRPPPPQEPDEKPTESESKTRKKLVLAPRTTPTAATPLEESGRSSSIFGEAKPVDTMKREMEIEEKMMEKQEESKVGGVVRLRSRDGSEIEIFAAGGGGGGEKWRSSTRHPPPNSSSSTTSSIDHHHPVEKDDHSDPEDERDFKQQQQQQQRERQQQQQRRGPGGGPPRSNESGAAAGAGRPRPHPQHKIDPTPPKRIIDQDGFEEVYRHSTTTPTTNQPPTTTPTPTTTTTTPLPEIIHNKFAALNSDED